MAENKTQPTHASVEDFIEAVPNAKRKEDAYTLLAIMNEITGMKPVMWGPSLIGYDNYHYKYDSGREGDFFITGFSPRKTNLVVYIMSGLENHKVLGGKLGKYKCNTSCLYINKLADVDMEALKQLISDSVLYMREKYH